MSIDLLFKIAAIGILVAVLYQVLVRAGREDQAMMTTLAGLIIVLSMVIKEVISLFDMYASIIAGVLILTMLTDTFKGIINLLQDISNKANVNTQFIKILIKITGIAILTEFAVSICKDTGENAIASKVDIGGKVIIISMSIPIISALLETVLKILP